MGLAARAQVRTDDPCEASSFNARVCRAAIQRHVYCAQGQRVPVSYQQAYPYYYDLYQQSLAQGGIANPAPVSVCGGGFPFFLHRGGFGSTGAFHSVHS
jgi:hypothetical protein